MTGKENKKAPESAAAPSQKTTRKRTVKGAAKSSQRVMKATDKSVARKSARDTASIRGTEKRTGRKSTKERAKTPVKIIPLGGLNEIGKNMTAYECGNDIFIVDCGIAFPDTDMLGVDLVIPDFSYVERNKDRVRGVVLTHGHEDHIGGLPFLLKVVNVPVYGTRLTLALVEGKLKEHGLLGSVQLNVVRPRDTVKLGCMAVEFIRVNHSIPDAVALAIHTPAGVIIQTGDFKIDYTPIEGGPFRRVGEQGCTCFTCGLYQCGETRQYDERAQCWRIV